MSSAASRARKVGRVVQRHAEPLVEVGGDGRQVVLERDGQRRADRLQARLVLAVLGARHALQAERAQAQVDAARRGRPPRAARAASTIASPWRASMRRWLAIARCSTAASAASRSPRSASAARPRASKAPLAIAAQLVHRREAALRDRPRHAVSLGPSSRHARVGLGELAGELAQAHSARAPAAAGRRPRVRATGRAPDGPPPPRRGRRAPPRLPPRRAAAPRAPRALSRAPSQCVASSWLGAPAASIASASARCSERRRIHGTSAYSASRASAVPEDPGPPVPARAARPCSISSVTPSGGQRGDEIEVERLAGDGGGLGGRAPGRRARTR